MTLNAMLSFQMTICFFFWAVRTLLVDFLPFSGPKFYALTFLAFPRFYLAN